MKTFRLLAASLFIAALSAVSAFAQTPQPAVTSAKIVYIDTSAFSDEKAGIGKVRTALTALSNEFKPVETDLQTMGTKFQNLQKEIQSLNEQAKNSKVPINQSTIQAKVDEYGKMERDFKFKQEDAKARYQSRYNALVGPIMQDIMKALQDFAKQKGYSMILDAAKLDEAGIILAVGNESADATKEFITFYNARPATTAATTTTPK